MKLPSLPEPFEWKEDTALVKDSFDLWNLEKRRILLWVNKSGMISLIAANLDFCEIYMKFPSQKEAIEYATNLAMLGMLNES